MGIPSPRRPSSSRSRWGARRADRDRRLRDGVLVARIPARVPVDILKIDRTFISAATGGTGGTAVAKAIVQLGLTLLLQTIAEGIEQAELQDSLLAMGCEIGQGFLFSPPLELSLVRERLVAEGSTGLRVVSSA